MSDSLLATISFSFFLGIPPFFLIGGSPHFRTLLVCFCFLDWSALTPCLCGVNFYVRTPVGFSGAVSLISWAGCSRHVLCVGYVDSPIAFGSRFLWPIHCGIFPLAGWEAQTPPHFVSHCTGADKAKPNNTETKNKASNSPNNSSKNSDKRAKNNKSGKRNEIVEKGEEKE